MPQTVQQDTGVPQQPHGLFTSEYEQEPVPLSRRRSLFSVAAVWAGFPMIITAAVTGATLVHGLGFMRGLLAMVIGNALLFLYVGTLSGLSARRGLSFPLQAARTFGRVGYIAASMLLSTLVLGWFSVQTGLLGMTMAEAFDVDPILVAVFAGVLFTLFTLLGIRALAVIGAVSVPLFLILGLFTAQQAVAGGGDIWSYAGVPSSPMALGVGITLVFALFADSGTMTADFTRWSKTPLQAWLATASAFPGGNLVAMVIGGVTAAATSSGTGDIFGALAAQGGFLQVIAVIFLFVNLGSVCAHCLYNSAVGWSAIIKGRMRILTLALGGLGIVIAALGVGAFFIDWLNLLGVIVPPIGAVIIVDQVLVRRAEPVNLPAVRWQPFAAWGLGSGLALAAHLAAPQLSAVVVGLAASAAAYLLLSLPSASIPSAARKSRSTAIQS